MLICSPIQFHPKMFPILLKLGVELFGLEADHWLIGPRLHSWHSSVLTALVGRSPPTPFIRALLLLVNRVHSVWRMSWLIGPKSNGKSPSRMTQWMGGMLWPVSHEAHPERGPSTLFATTILNWSPYDLTTGQYFLPLLSTHQKYPVLTLWWIE